MPETLNIVPSSTDSEASPATATAPISPEDDAMVDFEVHHDRRDMHTMASFGEELRRQRELRGVNLREISDATKINIRFLEALEENEFRHLPGGQFNKGFIRAYARHIGVDPESMVDAYLVELDKQEGSPRAVPRPTTVRSFTNDGREGRSVLRMVIVLLLLVALGAGAWWIRGRSAVSAQNPVTAPAVTEQATPAPQQTVPSAAPDANVGAGGANSANSTAAPTPPVATPAIEPATPPQPPPAATPSSTASQAASTKLILRAIAATPTHIALSCASQSVYDGTPAAGQVLNFTCDGVFEISLADAGAIALAVNGERIYVGRPGQPVAGRFITAANIADYTNAPPVEATP